MEEALDLDRSRKLPIRVRRGQTINYTIPVNNAAGSPFDFTGYTAELFVYTSFSKSDATEEFEITVTLDTGSMQLTHSPILRKREEFIYLLWMTDPDGGRQLWLNGPFVVLNREWDFENESETIVINPDGDDITLVISPDIADFPIEFETVTGTSYTVTEEDNGKYIKYTSSSNVTITLPNGLSDGHITQHVKKGTGDLIFVAAGTLESIGDTLEDQYTAALAAHEGSNVWGLYGKLT